MADKRGYMRYAINDRVALRDEAGALIIANAQLDSISFQGMSVQLKEKMEIGKVVCFEFTAELLGIAFSGKAVVKNMMELKHREKPIFRTGFAFLEINSDDLADLLNEIQRLKRENTGRNSSPRRLPDYGPF